MAMRRVALVAPSLDVIGGVQTVADFLYQAVERSGRFRVDRISLATSARDVASVRALAPRTWLAGPLLVPGAVGGRSWLHSGCVLSELEFQRYRPRRPLTDHLARYDIVQIVAGTPAWALVAREAGRPVVLQVATLAAVERRAGSQHARGARGVWRRAMTRITSRCDLAGLRASRLVVVENRWMLDAVRRTCGDDRVVFQPPGVDTERFRPSSPAPGSGYILSVARFADPRKNVGMLLRAYAAVRREVPDAPRLVLVGASTLLSRDRDLVAALDLAPHIDVREALAPDELVRAYQGAALFVLSSREEGLGMVILEAMACGVPVVATRCGGPEGVIEHGRSGYLVDIDDVDAMAGAIRRLLEEPARRAAMGRLAREQAVERFSLDAVGRRFVELYDRVLDAGRPAEHPLVATSPVSP
jgi:D-inositol-3-phosphate glycosyltransferase